MSLKHILLGMLHEPASGYDLNREFGESLRHFWAANLSQIYPLLARMEDDGLLKSRPAGSDRGPERKLYRRTAKGNRELVEWLTGGPQVNQERRHYLAQVYFLAETGKPEAALAFMHSLRALMQEKLRNLESIEKEWRRCDPRYPGALDDADFYRQTTLELGMKISSVHVDWCDRCIRRIKARVRENAS